MGKFSSTFELVLISVIANIIVKILEDIIIYNITLIKFKNEKYKPLLINTIRASMLSVSIILIILIFKFTKP